MMSVPQCRRCITPLSLWMMSVPQCRRCITPPSPPLSLAHKDIVMSDLLSLSLFYMRKSATSQRPH